MITKVKSQFEITDNKNTILLEVNYKEKKFDILTRVGNKEFIFTSQRWFKDNYLRGRQVIKLIQEAYDFVEKELNEPAVNS